MKARLSTDGGSRGNPGPAAYGYVLESEDGHVLDARGEAIGTATNNVAEYRGLIAGLDSAVQRGVDELEGEACEIVTIDALEEGKGIGTALLEAVVGIARETGCTRVQLLTTNNNLRALAFYQKRGFRLVGLVPGAIDEERKRKPSIAEFDSAGLPIRDELHLELPLR